MALATVNIYKIINMTSASSYVYRMTFEMYNNYFHLVHAFCVIFLAWPRPRSRTWPHALTASSTSLVTDSQNELLASTHLWSRDVGYIFTATWVPNTVKFRRGLSERLPTWLTTDRHIAARVVADSSSRTRPTAQPIAPTDSQPTHRPRLVTSHAHVTMVATAMRPIHLLIRPQTVYRRFRKNARGSRSRSPLPKIWPADLRGPCRCYRCATTFFVAVAHWFPKLGYGPFDLDAELFFLLVF